MSKSPPSTGQTLVACGFCGSVVDVGHARQRQVATDKGMQLAWVCVTCLHLGSEEQTKKYIKKEQKTVGG